MVCNHIKTTLDLCRVPVFIAKSVRPWLVRPLLFHPGLFFIYYCFFPPFISLSWLPWQMPHHRFERFGFYIDWETSSYNFTNTKLSPRNYINSTRAECVGQRRGKFDTCSRERNSGPYDFEATFYPRPKIPLQYLFNIYTPFTIFVAYLPSLFSSHCGDVDQQV